MLRAGYLLIAQKLQEAADSGDSLSASDIRSRLSDAINDAHRGTGSYAYYVDHFGDGESGDVIYCCDGDTCKAPYAITGGAGAVMCTIDTENAIDVVPRTVYEEEADEADHYAAMEAALKAEKLYTELPLYERFVSKDERSKADSSDFAGKGKSFPILKPEDVAAAAHSIGRAGSGNLGPSGIKARIISIAKRKGWTSKLPKAWQPSSESAGTPAYTRASRASRSAGNGTTNVSQGSDTQGAGRGVENSEGVVARERETSNKNTVKLVESATTLENIVLREAKADYEIKLIAPGKGSSAFYPAEVLKRDGPSVFKEGTHVYLNHATRAEEAERPEGDVKNLAGVLSKGAYWVESHAKGPGLYGRMKVFADHAQIVEEKAAHVGMSIRANGEAVMEAGRPLLKEGLPTLSKLTSAESVDVVTRAGAGGMILTEAANPANPTQEAAMDAAELTKLQESVAVANAANAKLLERALRGDAREEATRILAGITLPESSKLRVIDTVLKEALPKTEAGELDTVKFTEAVNAEAKREGVYVAGLTGSGLVTGMGPVGEAIPAREAEKPEEINARAVRIFERLGHSKEAAQMAVKGRVA